METETKGFFNGNEPKIINNKVNYSCCVTFFDLCVTFASRFTKCDTSILLLSASLRHVRHDILLCTRIVYNSTV